MLQARQFPRPSSTWSASSRATAVGWPVRNTARAVTGSRFAPLTRPKTRPAAKTLEPLDRDVGGLAEGVGSVPVPSYRRLRSDGRGGTPDAFEAFDVGREDAVLDASAQVQDRRVGRRDAVNVLVDQHLVIAEVERIV